MMLSRTLIALVALGAPAFSSASCAPSNDNGKCDFEPFNPYVCGPDYSCSYDTECHAKYAGYNVENDCCQAPQPSNCGLIYDPLICGSKQCPYSNQCIADLAGYSSSQCTSAPEPCPEPDAAQCSGEPTNPYKCGSGKQCKYDNLCMVEKAGFDRNADCCQDSRGNTACGGVIAPVSCDPNGKQCPYDNQCIANSAGYNEKQCCPAVPDGIACATMSDPVTCGDIPCQYPTQCEASAAGWQESECCKQPLDTSSCTLEYNPVACASIGCVYSNHCIAKLAGFDPNSCVSMAPDTMTTNGETSGATNVALSTTVAMGGAAALLPFLN